ncbi:YciI family protein [Nioella nitratireducens]|uniref:YciI family protein n=1 Tax=Nioella nitratireducens TaxID=1287720 RepID=UPI0008FD0EBE|nr:YciI family protein [Nioella nitratireducens]
MLYAVICTDKPGHLETRKANRDAHLAYLDQTKAQLAGPFLGEDGDMIGSLVVIEAEDRTAALAWAENDPYAKAGLFEKTRIEAWKKVIG